MSYNRFPIRRARIKALLLFAAIAITAVSCAVPGKDAVLSDLQLNPKNGRHIENVPFFPQTEHMCGPSALAGVMGYYGKGPGMEDVAKEVYNERIKGTLPIDLVLYAKEKGFTASYYSGGLADLKERLSQGLPVILFLNLGLGSRPIGHYITAVGFDDKLQVVLAHSGKEREAVFSYRTLLVLWERTGYTTLLITPKNHLKGQP